MKNSVLENIFISTNLNFNKEVIKINSRIKYISHFINKVNNNPGYLYIYLNDEEQLYVAKIKTISSKRQNDNECIKIKLGGRYIFINYQLNIRSYSTQILKYLYARQNSHNLKDVKKSIFMTNKKYNFQFSRPIIDEERLHKDFLNTEKLLDKQDFSNSILYKGLIIPPKEDGNKTYAFLIEEDEEYFLTLTNNKMIDLDLQYINEEYPQDLPPYKPYFYDFYPSESQKLKYLLSGLSDNKDEIFEVNFLLEEEIDNKENLIEGKVVFSASPIKRINAYIESLIETKNPDVIRKIKELKNNTKNKIKTEDSQKKIERKIMDGLIHKGNKFENELNVYNVGQGNWSKIDFKNHITKEKIFTIVFDIGIGNNAPENVHKIAVDAAKELNGNYMIMLSHWDQDHIKGIIHLEKEQFENLWVVPDLPKSNVSTGALRLAAFLHFDPFIESIFIDNSFNNKVIVDNNYLMLGKGEGRNSGVNVLRGRSTIKTKYNDKNNLGLILVIKNDQKKILLPGDCEYIQFPDKFINVSYNFFVASHHGANTNIKDLSDVGFFKVAKDTKAIVCVGDVKDYPCPVHMLMLEKLGYVIEKTKDIKSNSYKYKF